MAHNARGFVAQSSLIADCTFITNRHDQHLSSNDVIATGMFKYVLLCFVTDHVRDSILAGSKLEHALGTAAQSNL